MSDAQDDLIRERAYAIWQAEGCPDNRQDQHWQQATAELAQVKDEAAQDDDAASSAPAAAGDTADAGAADPVEPVAEPEAPATPAVAVQAPTDPIVAETAAPVGTRNSRKSASAGSGAPRGRRKKGD